MITLFDHLMSADMLDCAGTDPVRVMRRDTGEIFELERQRLGYYLLDERLSADRGSGWYGFGIYLESDLGEVEKFGEVMRTLIARDTEGGAV